LEGEVGEGCPKLHMQNEGSFSEAGHVRILPIDRESELERL